MKKQQQPLMLAYIIFLVICCVYHFVSDIFDLEYPIWERVVVAATLASYFFSLSSACKSVVKFADLTLDCYLRIDMSLYRTFDSSDEAEEKADTELMIEKNADRLVEIKKEKRKYEQRAFVLDVLGFLVFFIIMAFDFVFLILSNTQELVTLMAFIIILLMEYLEGIFIENFNKVNTAADILLKNSDKGAN